MLGRVIAGRFRVETLLGEGQMARVYAATQLSMSRRVALKVLRSELMQDAEASERFRREVRAVALLRSPHTIEFYDFGELEGGERYIAMEHLEGETLRQRLERHPKLAPPEVIAIVSQLAASLGEAHAAGVIHRDLKPENVEFVTAATPIRPFMKVLDFGLAKLVDPDDDEVHITGRHRTVGTPAYLAPESATSRGHVDWRSDLYSLAVIIFEMLVGQRPFQAPSPMQMLIAHLREAIPSARALGAELPAGIDQFFATALAKDPQERFANADTLLQALKNILK